MDNPEEIKLEDIAISQSITPETVINIDDKVNAGNLPVVATVSKTIASEITNTIGEEIKNNPNCSILNNNKVYGIVLTLIGLIVGGIIELLILKYIKIDTVDSNG
jgi:hypothetical protein